MNAYAMVVVIEAGDADTAADLTREAVDTAACIVDGTTYFVGSPWLVTPGESGDYETDACIEQRDSESGAEILHLSLPRGGSICGADGPSTSEHTAVSCVECATIHDTLAGECDADNLRELSGASVTTWADGFGVWHVRVSRHAASPLIAARRALRHELTLRESPTAPVAREIYMRPVRVTGLDTEDTIVYREGECSR
jgi:hypothetical protein